MTIKEQLTVDWMILPLMTNGGGGVGKWNISISKDLNKAKFNHFNPMDIWLMLLKNYLSNNHWYVSLSELKFATYI